MFYEILSLTLVALLWGGTNPLIKKGTTDIAKVKANSALQQFILELKYLFMNINYIVPMVLNQLGSLLYFLMLQKVDLSLAVPVANSLTFVFTALVGWILNEAIPSKRTIAGVCLIISGSTLLCYDKYLVQST